MHIHMGMRLGSSKFVSLVQGVSETVCTIKVVSQSGTLLVSERMYYVVSHPGTLLVSECKY